MIFRGDALLLWGMEDFCTADGTLSDTFSGNVLAHLGANQVATVVLRPLLRVMTPGC